jgi:uncharacterized phage protein (TIGR01671 family)
MELKYRMFYQGEFITPIFDGQYFYEDFRDLEDGRKIEDCKIELFTGLKDKNGTPIYDGDVINIVRYKGQWHQDIINNVFVKFTDCSFTYSHYSDNISQLETGLFTCVDHDIEIIGNIHQDSHLLDANPELLEK